MFNHPQFGEIRTVILNDETWLIAKDLCNVLGLKNVSQALASVDEEDKTNINPNVINYDIGISNVLNKHTIGIDVRTVIPEAGRGGRDLLLVNEPGFYTLVLRSNMPEAKKFRKWVTSEVLPAIRKTGGYIASTPEETPEQIMARALLVAQRTIESHKQKLQMLEGEVEVLQAEKKVLAPKAIYTDEVLQSTSTFTLTQVAHDLGFRSVYAFTAWAKEKGLLFYQSEQWQPTANVSGKGYFTTRTARYIKNDNTIGTSLSTVVTEKGRMFLHGLRKWGA